MKRWTALGEERNHRMFFLSWHMLLHASSIMEKLIIDSHPHVSKSNGGKAVEAQLWKSSCSFRGESELDSCLFTWEPSASSYIWRTAFIVGKFPHCCNVLEQTMICSWRSAVVALTSDLPLKGVVVEENRRGYPTQRAKILEFPSYLILTWLNDKILHRVELPAFTNQLPNLRENHEGDVALSCVIDQPETKQHNPNSVNIMPFSHLRHFYFGFLPQ